jgi:hypothetical protein
MAFAEDNTVQGTFTSAGAATRLNLGFVPTEYHAWNFTQQNSVANPAVVKEVWWNNRLAAGGAYTMINTAGAATNANAIIATLGITQYTGIEEVLGAAQVGTAITAASPAQVTVATHGYSTGETIRITGSTGMLQYAGLDFTITYVGANVFGLDGGVAAAFAAPATALVARRVIVPRAFAPARRVITMITQANPGVVTTSVNHGFVTGQRVRLRVGAGFGMTQVNEQIYTVVVVTPTTFQLFGTDTTAFTAFAYPTSAAAALGVTFPDVEPAGEVAQTLLGAEKNNSFAGLWLDTGVVGAANDVWHYIARRAAIS